MIATGVLVIAEDFLKLAVEKWLVIKVVLLEECAGETKCYEN